jgi:hypothetical protein
VVLELGIFASRLGRERTFMVLQQTKEELHLPSDLQGITSIKFDWPVEKRFDHDFKDLHAAIGSAAQSIRAALKENGTDEEIFKPLSGGMIFLALWLQGRGHSIHELVEPFQRFQKQTSRLGPGASAYASKAAKYACQCLEAVGIAQHFGGDEYSLTPLGKDLLDSGKLRERFANSYEAFDQLKK